MLRGNKCPGGDGWVSVASSQPPIPTSNLPFYSPGTGAGQIVLNGSQVQVWGRENRGLGRAAVT